MRARFRATPEPLNEAELRQQLGFQIESHLARAGVRDRILLGEIVDSVDSFHRRRDRIRRTAAAVDAMHVLVSIFTDAVERENELEVDTILAVFRRKGWIDVEMHAIDDITPQSIWQAGGPVECAAWIVSKVTGIPVLVLNEHRTYRRPSVVDTLRPSDDADVFFVDLDRF